MFASTRNKRIKQLKTSNTRNSQLETGNSLDVRSESFEKFENYKRITRECNLRVNTHTSSTKAFAVRKTFGTRTRASVRNTHNG